MGRRTALGAAMFMLTVTAVGGRICHRLDDTARPSSSEAALVDFRDAVYYPVVALLDGENPYDRERVVARYPIAGTIGLYAPSALLLHLPFGLLPYRGAEAAFVATSVLLIVLLAWLAWRIQGVDADCGLVLGLAAALVITRPGHWNVFLGQVALEAGLATIAALWLAPRRPLLAGVALGIATFKPTYGLPLAVLLAARGAWRVLAVGALVGGALTAIPLAVIVGRVGAGGFVDGVMRYYGYRSTTPALSAAYSTYRVDVVALVARGLGAAPGIVPTLALTVLVLGVACAVLRRLRDDDPTARRLALGIASLAIVLCTYHQQYDLLVLAPLLVAAWPLTPLRRAQLPAALVAGVFANYLATGGMQRATGVGEAAVLRLSSLNIVALLVAYGLLVAEGLRVAAGRRVASGPLGAPGRPGSGERVVADE